MHYANLASLIGLAAWLSACGAADFGSSNAKIGTVESGGQKRISTSDGADGDEDSDSTDSKGNGDSDGDGDSDSDGDGYGDSDGDSDGSDADGGDDLSSDDDDLGGKGSKIRFTTVSLCSDFGEKAAGSILRSQGIVMKLVPTDGGADVTVKGSATTLRDKILASSSFTTSISAPSGSYHVLLCDTANADACQLTIAPEDFKTQDIKSFFLKEGRKMNALGVSEHPLELKNGKLSGSAPSLWVVLDGRRDDADATRCDENSSPLIFDFTQKGIELSAPRVAFDIDAEGTLAKLSWVTSAETMLLALDRNANGTIDSGAELFGNHTASTNGQSFANGFAALGQYDLNHDGIIDARDPVFQNLRLWSDKDFDARTDAGELLPLAAKHVKFINVSYKTATTRDIFGNLFSERSTAVLDDDSSVAVVDVWFRKFVSYDLAGK